MKLTPKYLVLLAGLALLASPMVRAQDADKPADAPKRERGGGGRGNPGAMWDRAAKELNLTADQQAKWKEIAEQERAATKPIMDDQSLSREDKRAKMMEAAKPFVEQRKAVLDADQTKKFDELQARMRERGGRGGRGERGPKPAGDAPKPDAPKSDDGK